MKLRRLIQIAHHALLLSRGDLDVPCGRCGHTYDLHVHNRKGTDCAICTDECPAFKL